MTASYMAQEIDEIPGIAASMAEGPLQGQLRETADWLAARDPALVLTIARGSSAHACTYLSHVIARLLHRPVAPVGLSLRAVFDGTLAPRDAVALAVSQSGSSPDLAEAARMLVAQGTPVLALTNTPGSRLSEASSRVTGFGAGPEHAVAATKTYFASILAGLWLIVHWARDDALLSALRSLPKTLKEHDRALSSEAASVFATSSTVVVIGRGAGLGIAREVALKLQELCGVYASAFSAAELLHGPRAMLSADTPVIALRRGAGVGLGQAIDGMAGQSVPVHVIGDASVVLHPLVDPLLDLMPLYRALEAAARSRGKSPDAPEFLSKETITR